MQCPVKGQDIMVRDYAFGGKGVLAGTECFVGWLWPCCRRLGAICGDATSHGIESRRGAIMHAVCADVSQESRYCNSCIACHVPLSSSAVQACVHNRCVVVFAVPWLGWQPKSIELNFSLHMFDVRSATRRTVESIACAA